MRWLWFATFTLTCALVAVYLRQPLILIGEVLIVDLFITRRIRLLLRLKGSHIHIPYWLNLTIWLIFTTWMIRVLAIGSVVVESAGMQPVLDTGDRIIVSKLSFGPRLPFTGKHLDGINGIRRGDLLAYHFPEGDSVVRGSDGANYYALRRQWELADGRPAGVEVLFRPLPLRRPEISRCAGIPGDTVVIGSPIGSQTGDYNIFPHDAGYPWDRDNFGPVIVPKKGTKTGLTLENLCLYKRIIEVYENNELEIRDGTVYINGSHADSYTFRMDYYFVLGDNRQNSRDSRHWGFLPEDHIIGEPVFSWFSTTLRTEGPFRIRWNRIFRAI